MAQVLGLNKIPIPTQANTPKRTTLKEQETELIPPEPVKLPTLVTFTFATEGYVYKIYSDAKDDEYVFSYEGKQGIHHMFREIRGGWSRTFTDAQLIGKKIEEKCQ